MTLSIIAQSLEVLERFLIIVCFVLLHWGFAQAAPERPSLALVVREKSKLLQKIKMISRYYQSLKTSRLLTGHDVLSKSMKSIRSSAPSVRPRCGS